MKADGITLRRIGWESRSVGCWQCCCLVIAGVNRAWLSVWVLALLVLWFVTRVCDAVFISVSPSVIR